MGETSRPWIERIFWLIAFVISTIGCAMLIAEMFEKLQTNPITVSLAERPSSIQEVNEPLTITNILLFAERPANQKKERKD